MRKLLCNNSEVPRVFAHILDDGGVDIVRQDQRFIITGKDFTIVGTNPQGEGKTVLQVVDGKLIEDGLEFKVEEPPVTGEPDNQPKPVENPKPKEDDNGTEQ